MAKAFFAFGVIFVGICWLTVQYERAGLPGKETERENPRVIFHQSKHKGFFPELHGRAAIDPETGEWTEEAYRLLRGTGEENMTED